jgi:hypothetical protein
MMITSAIDADLRERLDRDGYALVEGVFDPAADFAPVLRDWNAILDEIADDLIGRGTLGSRFDGRSFAQRLTAICAETGLTFAEHFDITLPQSTITADTPLNLPTSLFDLLTHPRLLSLVEQAIGPEIAASPVQHIRMKLPRRALRHELNFEQNGLLGRVGWHQDGGVVLPEADEAGIVSVWFPFADATVLNGCLRVIPGSHRKAIVDHCPSDSTGLSIPDRLVRAGDAVAVPMRAGSALFFHRRLIHESLDNATTDEVRISADFRFQRIGEPTGRPIYPAVPVRSDADPACVVDAIEWRRVWDETRARLAGVPAPAFNRWNADTPACA